MNTVQSVRGGGALRLRPRVPRRLVTAWAVPSLRYGGVLLLALVAINLTMAVIADDPMTQNLEDAFSPPGSEGHLLGTDSLGRDLLTWIAAGIRTSMLVSVAVVLLSASVGVLIGVVAGYLGGFVDSALMRLVDLQLAVPALVLFVAASAVFRPSTVGVVLLLSAVAWVPYARIVRARVQAERERAYVAAARLSGLGPMRIAVLHLLPAVATLVIVYASLQAGYVLLWEAGLSFLGLGVQPPDASLGFMIAQGKDSLATEWWITTLPGVALVLIALGFNLLGDGLRDLFELDTSEVAVR